MSFLLRILLSAALFNLSYWVADYCGFCILFFLFPLYSFFVRNLNLKRLFNVGLGWGILAFGGNLFWVYVLISTKADCSKFIAFLIYFVLVLLMAVTAGFFFILLKLFLDKFKNRALKIFIFLFGWYLYFLFLADYFPRIIGKNVRYPFILPVVPLSSFKFFLKMVSWVFLPFNGSYKEKINCDFLYLKPHSQYLDKSRAELAGDIYCKIKYLNSDKRLYNNNVNEIIIAPESMFPFVLNYDLKVLNLVEKVLLPKQKLIIGAKRQEGEKYFQSVYVIEQGRIIQFYDKTIMMPFGEKLSKFWKTYFNFAADFFLKNKIALSKGKSSTKTFVLNDNCEGIPRICSEFFWQNDKQLIPFATKQNKVILAFVDDDWFCSYLRKLMTNYAAFKSAKLGVSIIYIDFSGVTKFQN
ncbi:TPA: hypothetical protein DEO28_03625 [Candidatus Dependentiae bacterium]|nr:hypothetical protein [Candidatus Dependentiae bacterium]HBZ73571.1 hypothetical protein [Candidatus Dependentiae bacterium]